MLYILCRYLNGKAENHEQTKLPYFPIENLKQSEPRHLVYEYGCDTYAGIH